MIFTGAKSDDFLNLLANLVTADVDIVFNWDYEEICDSPEPYEIVYAGIAVCPGRQTP